MTIYVFEDDPTEADRLYEVLEVACRNKLGPEAKVVARTDHWYNCAHDVIPTTLWLVDIDSRQLPTDQWRLHDDWLTKQVQRLRDAYPSLRVNDWYEAISRIVEKHHGIGVAIEAHLNGVPFLYTSGYANFDWPLLRLLVDGIPGPLDPDVHFVNRARVI